jgi:predicted DNA-binding protein (MmcQ/YjbR family)
MANLQSLRTIALSFPEAVEEPHFEKTSFRVRKKIFATSSEGTSLCTVKLSLKDQDLFGLHDSSAIYPVPNKWGMQGWTIVDLAKVKDDVLREILISAYTEVAPSSLNETL